MNSNVTAALISAAATTSAAFIVAYKEQILELFRHNSRDWSGLWTGTVNASDTKTTYKVTAKLKQVGHTITGRIWSEGPEVLEYTIKGTVHEPEYMTYYAVNSNKNTVNYLVGINRFDRGAKKISGKYLARSRLVQRISAGTIELQKSQ